MRKKQVMFAFLFSGLLLTMGQQAARAQDGTADSAPRIWRAQSGGFATKATFLKFENGVV